MRLLTMTSAVDRLDGPPTLRAAVRYEMTAWLARESDVSLGDLFGRLGSCLDLTLCCRDNPNPKVDPHEPKTNPTLSTIWASHFSPRLHQDVTLSQNLRFFDPNKRTSAHNMYDNYISEADKFLSPPSESQHNRNSGVSNLGMGPLNMRVAAASAGSSPSKPAALAAATQSPSPTHRQPSPTQQQHNAPQPQQQQQQQQRPPQQQQQRPPQQQQQQPPQQQQRPPQQQQQWPSQKQQQRPPQQQQQQQQPLQPTAALNLAQPPPSLPPTGLGRLPRSANPFEPPAPPFPSSPSPSTPHPLQPLMTPIKPTFALPSSSPSSPSQGGGGGPAVTFSTTTPTPRKPIIRSNSEDPLLPTRGEKGDVFWRRFSMIAKEELAKPRGAKDSSWLKKTQNGNGRMNRWVGIVSVLLILCIVAAVGLGIYFNRNAPGHQQPKVFGGVGMRLGVLLRRVRLVPVPVQVRGGRGRVEGRRAAVCMLVRRLLLRGGRRRCRNLDLDHTITR
ncbi:uncharacterized protein LACBIDRAFT_318546 [Laccaria bicolor S238N-H82]|uniref:Predicted protein n=1 Tax=Laccaria bicolor (strain S238N-H82 / ATCC MYA-4686) TaxID=486041 RepID=B0E2M1_LACBS|nr:uncharacterized protein LACBIDRAFT_318546 [Laccaria bicolor S238N-H82]EDQ98901.1 predicted protein [Laccaria bicolor S238N-H82]|eukprot:XP_001890446.1 predicted protein [Laccaria bicolor S238N-H82]